MDNDDLDVEMQCPYKKIILERENGEIDVHNITNPENKSPKGEIFSDDNEYIKTESSQSEPMEEVEENFTSEPDTKIVHLFQEPSCEKQNYSEGLKDFHILDEVQGDSDNEEGNNSNLSTIVKRFVTMCLF